MLAPVHSARFQGANEIAPEGCFPGTRVDLLKQLYAWVMDTAAASVLWLSGLAGTGKTTVARSVCTHFRDSILGASFFISRASADRRSARGIILSVAYQLGGYDPGVFAAIVDALREDHDITTKPNQEQMETAEAAGRKRAECGRWGQREGGQADGRDGPTQPLVGTELMGYSVWCLVDIDWVGAAGT